MSKDIVVLSAARTPIGAFQGNFSGISSVELGANVISKVLTKAGLEGEHIDEVIFGCVLQAGLGQAPARHALIKAGLPNSIPGYLVNKVCGSGMKSVVLALQSILLGAEQTIIAGGMESMTGSPHLLPKSRGGIRLGHGEVLDHMFVDGLEDAHSGQLMGYFAESTASRYQISREEQDDFALMSLEKAKNAIQRHQFNEEIVPIKVSLKTGTTDIYEDELPNRAKPEKVRSLKPAFIGDGTVTAANSSGIGDGAAALTLCSSNFALDNSFAPIARIIGYSQHAAKPEWFTIAPIGAINKLLDNLNWKICDVDLFEINEAFAVVTITAIKELSIPLEKVNVNGGACALGHPIGASGARILVTLINALRSNGLTRGIAAICVGGGEALAVAVEVTS